MLSLLSHVRDSIFTACAFALLQSQLERLRREEEAAQRAANDLVDAWKRAKAEAHDAAVRSPFIAADCILPRLVV